MCKKILLFCSLMLGLSSQAAVTPIADLRAMLDPVNYRPTDTNTLFTAEGVVTTHTNLQATHALFYIQDATAGISFFYRDATTVRPKAGELVRVTGPLSHFNGLLQFEMHITNVNHMFTSVSSNNPLPAPTSLVFSLTNNTAAIEALEASYVVASNVFIQAGGSFTGNSNVTITNEAGETFRMRIVSGTDLVGKSRPTGPVNILGVLSQADFEDPRTDSYQLIPTRFADIVPKGVVVLFTNILSNLVRPGDATTNSTFNDYALRPTETITIHTRSFDQEGSDVTVNPITNNLPPNAQWNTGTTTGTNVSATFTFTPNSMDAGSNFVVVLQVYTSKGTNNVTWNIYVPTAAEQNIIISEFLANPTTDTNSPFFNPLYRSLASTNPAAADEFIEVANLGPSDVELLGWTVSDDALLRHTFFDFFPVASSNAVIVYGGDFGGGTPNLPVPAEDFNPGSANSIFNNGGDSITLRNASNNVVARVVYGTLTTPNGIALTRYPTLTNDFLRHDAASCTNSSPGTQYDGLTYSVPPVPVTNTNAPTISDIPDQVTQQNTAVGPISFTVSDVDPGILMVSASSSNPTLVQSISLGSMDNNNRTITITPAAGQSGLATIIVTVKDGGDRCLNETFLLSVSPDIGIILCDSFDYADGSLITNSMFLWNTHSGTTGQVQVVGGQLKLLQSQGEDVNAKLTNAPYLTGGAAVLYAGFTVNFQSLPSLGGEYFAHFWGSNTLFRARVFASTINASAGKYRLGIANNATSMDAQLATDLSLDTTYGVVVRYGVSSGLTTLWVNPTSESSPSVSATDDPSLTTINGFAFRQTTGIGTNCVDNLKVAGRFFLGNPLFLTIIRDVAGVKISWPKAATDAGYVLQRSLTLGPSASWGPFGTPSVEGDQSVVSISNPTGNAFFRLFKEP